ncbi:MAG TPA: hypothetical protein DCO89_00975 [Clostridiales bacterium]|nr:hypothetical protein [Clostridiales bacterium]
MQLVYDIYMVIYVEYVIVDNLIIDYLILNLTNFFLKSNTSKFNMIMSSIMATAITLFTPLMPYIINLLLKPLLSLLMILICFKYKNFKTFCLELLTFYFCTFLMIGTCLGICEMLGIKYLINNGLDYEYNFPIGFILLICTITFVCSKNIIANLFSKHKYDKFLYDLILVNGNKKIKVLAFLDTGNKLQIDGKAISILGYKTFYKLYPNLKITDILLHKEMPLKNSKYIYINGIGKSEKVLIFEIDKIIFKEKQIENPVLGLSLNRFEKNTNSDLIISNNLIGDNYELCKD